MKQMIVLACLAVMACAVPVEDNFVLKFEPMGKQLGDVHKHWEDFKKTHGKTSTIIATGKWGRGGVM
jgi:hypothetical protein